MSYLDDNLKNPPGFFKENYMNTIAKNTQNAFEVTVVGTIIKKVRQFVEINCKFPYPEERYFTEIAIRCITDAHGSGDSQLSHLQTKKLWNYLKEQALLYIEKVQKKFQIGLESTSQIDYYLDRFDTDSSKIDKKLAKLNFQFSDGNDEK